MRSAASPLAPNSYTLPDLVAVIRLELDQSRQRAGSYAADPSNWHAKLYAEHDQLAARLRAELGAVITSGWNGDRVNLAGITATSTGGLAGALGNWCAAAERQADAA